MNGADGGKGPEKRGEPPAPETAAIGEEIREWKTKRGALILAHNYQLDEVQEIADLVGDSLALSRRAAESDCDTIVFCGVRFMAESAKILSPRKRILLPAPRAGCPLADFAEPGEVRAWRKRYPRAAVVAYINSSAAVKAEADICCTSSNAVRVVASLDEDEIIFLPDQNLGRFVAARFPDKLFHLWPGYCLTHHRVLPEHIREALRKLPDAEVLVHPECRPEVVELADFVGSTAQILARVGASPAPAFIIGTEMGVIPGLRRAHPDKKIYLPYPGLFCPTMKQISLKTVAESLKTMQTDITVPDPIADRARTALERMLEAG
ncbi:MAG TPA: quinolinate synthase NadA [bacterium]|nr:quinolinate synthase NadA [bacterium]HPQ67383.1 quinolinate synthase NadA [bacterium]